MRIVAGKLKGLKLNTFEYGNIRPTLDSVRESIFNKIQFGISGANFLDLFAGTGVFSIEAYSRGASVIYACDVNINSIKLINTNIKKAKIDNQINVLNKDYIDSIKFLADKNIKFDYVFLDPPFESDFGNKAINKICEYGLMSSDGVIIYEHALSTKVEIPSNFEVFNEKKYGTIMVSYIKVKNND